MLAVSRESYVTAASSYSPPPQVRPRQPARTRTSPVSQPVRLQSANRHEPGRCRDGFRDCNLGDIVGGRGDMCFVRTCTRAHVRINVCAYARTSRLAISIRLARMCNRAHTMCSAHNRTHHVQRTQEDTPCAGQTRGQTNSASDQLLQWLPKRGSESRAEGRRGLWAQG
jgi:hypothetical protein